MQSVYRKANSYDKRKENPLWHIPEGVERSAFEAGKAASKGPKA